jgi:g-D-glutamyl-meso-diaminopimelate peptidase
VSAQGVGRMRRMPVALAVAGLVLAMAVPAPPLPPVMPAVAEVAPAPEAPAPATVIFHPDQVYTYETLTRDLASLRRAYPQWVEYRSIGQTDYGREIWAARLGHGPATLLINAAHHASEWLTAALAMAMLDQYAAAAAAGGMLDGEPAADLLNRATIWFVPMVNPDGVTLAQAGPEAFPADARAELARLSGGVGYARWKANAKGIDLNRQYPADWAHICCNPPGPAYANYKGAEPLQAPEARAMVALTYEVDPQITVSYHSAGRVIYWHFHNQPAHLARDQRLAEELAAVTGYALVPPQENPSGGGYKDWFVQTFGRPGFTPEIGEFGDGQPLTPAAFAEEWERNHRVGPVLAREAYALWLQTERGAQE